MTLDLPWRDGEGRVRIRFVLQADESSREKRSRHEVLVAVTAPGNYKDNREIAATVSDLLASALDQAGDSLSLNCSSTPTNGAWERYEPGLPLVWKAYVEIDLDQAHAMQRLMRRLGDRLQAT
jgi:hypothetical protein